MSFIRETLSREDIKKFNYGSENKEPIKDEHLQKVVKDIEEKENRKLTTTEVSAVESMLSEHASYASSRPFLKKLPTKGANHIKTIGDEAAAAVMGVNSQGKTIVAAYSSESHNSPSFVCAHPGAATGTGGCERDQIALTGNLPAFVLEARRQSDPLNNSSFDPIRQHLMETTMGIGDYANAMGIPHGDGSIKFNSQFAGNNLVNVMAVSHCDKERLLINHVPQADNLSDYVAIYVGKGSDKTGVGGTKFASDAIDMTNTELNEKAVQDPDPHLQEVVTRGIEKVVDLAIEENWMDKFSLKDMGAAGLLCSTVEQLRDGVGVIINGDIVPANEDLTPTEMLETETQERFMFYVHKDYADKVVDVFNVELGLPNVNVGACAKIIGECNDSGRYTFVKGGKIEVDLDQSVFLDPPIIERERKTPNRTFNVITNDIIDLNLSIDKVLGSNNFKSDEKIYSHYDAHIQTTNIVNRGEGSAMLRVVPGLENRIGISASFDSNTRYGLLDAKFQAEDSFLRGAYNMASQGCSVVGVTNNANYGRTDHPEEFEEFVLGQEGVGNICKNWYLEDDYLKEICKDSEVVEKFKEDSRRHITVNSGNCSLNKANKQTGAAIPPTSMLGLIGWTNSPENHTKWDLSEGTVYLIGDRQDSFGATDYADNVHGKDNIGGELFEVDYIKSQKEVTALIKVVRSGLTNSTNNIEEGGLCNAIAEMVANTNKNVVVNIDLESKMAEIPLSDKGKLFSESYGTLVVVTPENENHFLKIMKSYKVKAHSIGKVVETERDIGQLSFTHKTGQIKYSQTEIKKLYNSKLENHLNEREIFPERLLI